MDTDSSSDAWERWLSSQAGKFLLFARSRTPCLADAEDVLQEALVESWERTPVGREPDDALVFATIRRRAMDQARGRNRRIKRENCVAEEGDDVWFTSEVEDAETRALLEKAVRELPDSQREVVTLKIWGGLTFVEIAEIAGCPANTAASRYRYGIETLRSRLKEVLA